MITYLKSNNLSFFKAKRLVFKEGPAEKVIGDIEAAVAPEKAFATTGLDEKAVLWNESAAKKGSEVNQFLKDTDEKAGKAIPKKLVLAAAQKDYDEVGGDQVKGVVTNAKNLIPAIPEGTKWEDKDVKGKAVSALEAANFSKFLIDKVKQASSYEAAISACDSLIPEAEKRKKTLEAAKSIDFYKKNLRNNMQMIAETCVQQKQQERFDLKRAGFIKKKVDALFVETKEMDDEAKKDLPNKKKMATAYLEGLLSAVELTLEDKDKADAAFEAQLTDYDAFLNSFVNENPLEDSEYTGKLTKGLKPVKKKEVYAYLEGLIDSSKVGSSKAIAFVIARINSMPKKDRDDLDKVKKACATMHTEEKEDAMDWVDYGLTYGDKKDYEDVNKDAEWFDQEAARLNKSDKPEDKKEAEKFTAKAIEARGLAKQTEDDYKNAKDIMDKDPNVKEFFKQRMAEAYQLYAGKPNVEANMATYRSMMLYQIAASQKLDNEKKPMVKAGEPVIDMKMLSASIRPTTMFGGAEKIGVGRNALPKGVRAAKNMPPGTGAFALNLVKRLGRNVAVGTIIAFMYKGRHFYGYVPKAGDLNILEYPKGYREPKEKVKDKGKEEKIVPPLPLNPS